MTYPQTAGFKKPGTSSDAAAATEPRRIPLAEQIIAALTRSNMTPDECAAALNKSILAIRPRFSELYKQGKIEPTGLRRRNASGMNADVWRLVWSQPTLPL